MPFIGCLAMTRKIISIVIGLLFALFAFFQYNDPDPWGWILAYGYVAVSGFLAAAGRSNKLVILVGLAAYTIGIIYLAPSVYQWVFHHRDVSLLYGMSADRMYIEESRECLGLVIAWLGLAYFYTGLPNNQA